MKRIISAVFAAVMILSLLPITAQAATSGACGDNLTWTLDDSGTLTISGTGEMPRYSTSTAPWYSSRNNIKKVIIEEGVTNIGRCAFYGYSYLTDAVISDSVTAIDGYAFADCGKLTNITLGNGVKSLGDDTFLFCNALTNITFPASLSDINSSAFRACCNLEITVDENNPYFSSLDGVLFNKDKSEIILYVKDKIQPVYEIPNGVTSVGKSAFSGCSYLTNVTIPDGVTNIGIFAFAYCKLAAVKIPDSVTKIAQGAFYNCKYLTDITLGNSVRMIDSSAFAECLKLTSLNIPDSVTVIGGSAFYGCSGLEITVSEDNKNYSSLDGVLFNKDKTELVAYAKDKIQPIYTIPDSVTIVGFYAFYNCSYLKDINIPESVKSIKMYAFDGSTNIKKIMYDGSEERWKKVSIAQSNKGLTNTEIYYGKISNYDWKINSYLGGIVSITAPDNVTDRQKLNIFIGAYSQNEDGTEVLLDYRFAPFTTTLSDIEYAVNSGSLSGSKIKVMLWDNDMKPLTDYLEI